MKIIFYIRKFKSLSHSSIFICNTCFTYYRAFQCHTELSQKKKEAMCLCLSRTWITWLMKAPWKTAKCQSLTFQAIGHETISVRGHYILPLSRSALLHLLSNSMDIAWPAVDSYLTFPMSFYIYYFYSHVIYQGIR